MDGARARMVGSWIVVFAALGAAAPSALAVDLSVASIEVTQGFQDGTVGFVGGRSTMVRASISISGSGQAVPGVDAVLRMFVNGVEWPAGPFFSQNGPIAAPLGPQQGVLNHTLNFIVVPPIASSVVFKVTVNPTLAVPESNTANNIFTSASFPFQCRAVVDLAYVPMDYLPNGGLPDQSLMDPGSGDNFLRGVFAVGEWNYHRSPLGALVWDQDINGSTGELFTALMDIRVSLIPGAGYAKPEFVYAWLPGNPYSGNGAANGIPGSVAFGNTSIERWQRTFAHEIGHCWGRPHSNDSIAFGQIDVEHHLKDPLDLGPMHASSKKDVMVAGLLTNQAWVSWVTYNDCLTDERSQCVSFAPPANGGDGDFDAWWPQRRPAAADEQRCVRVAGVLTHEGRSVRLVPCMRFDRASPTIDDPLGDLAIEAADAAGRVLHRVRVRTDTMRESCAGDGSLNPTASIHVLMPETPGGVRIDRVVVRDLAGAEVGAKVGEGVGARAGAAAVGVNANAEAPVLASIDRSPSAPTLSIDSIMRAVAAMPPGNGEWKSPPIEIRWSAQDPDGGALAAMLLYSPDGGTRWAPISVNPDGGSVIFDPANLPGALPGRGLVRLRVGDGLNVSETDAVIESMFMLGNPPDVHIISPNADTYLQGATLVLHASGWDMEDEYLPNGSFQWSSSLDGPIGVGRLLSFGRLSPGAHVITLVGVDSDGNASMRTIPVTITPRALPSADLNGDGRVDGNDLGTLLGSWGSFGVGDLDFNGVVDGGDLGILLGEWTS